MNEHQSYSWEQLPEYRSAQRFAHSLGRVLASLPRRWRRRIAGPLTRASALIACCIVMANADALEDDLPEDAKDEARRLALEAVAAAREGLQILQEAKKGSAPDLLVSLDLLERIEQGIRREQAAA